MPSSNIAVITLPHINGRAADAVQNTFAFYIQNVTDGAQTTAIRLAFASFYALAAPGATSPVSAYLAPTVDRTSQACRMAFYNIDGHLDGSPHGSPWFTDTFTMTSAPPATNTPPQVASVATLRGDNALTSPVEGPGGVRPRQRRSGRVYIGPLASAAVSSGSTDAARPSLGLRTDVLAAFEKLSDDLVAQQATLCVWSRANAALHEVTRVEMDDSFDVIRSRKANPTLRTVRTFSPVPDLKLAV